MVLGLAELSGIDRAGIYVVSMPCLKSPKIYKIGKTTNLRKRLDSYQLYYPFGVLVELLWIFPRRLGKPNSALSVAEKYIHNHLTMVHSTTRRAKTEWYKDGKQKIVDVFLDAFDHFRYIGGQIENPNRSFVLADMTIAETRKNKIDSRRMLETALSQLAHMQREHPDDYDFLCTCNNWIIDRKQNMRCASGSKLKKRTRTKKS